MPKGITPVVATILLLMITISITGVSFVFMQRSAQTAAQSGEQQLNQQAGQIGSIFSIEGADKNNVYIKNMGARSLNASSLNFYVNNVLVESNSIVIAPGTVGTVALNDSKLAMLPDPAELKVTSASFSDKITADFYGKYAIAYWKFDEGSGIVAKDSSRNGNDGTITGAGWSSGKYGSAIDFSGTGQYAEKDWPDFNIVDYTIQFWMKADTLSNYWQDMTTIDSENGRFHLDKSNLPLHEGNHIYWYGVDGGNSLDSNVVPTIGQWYHVAGTHQGTTIKIYVNGDIKGTGSTGKDVTYTNSKKLHVGVDNINEVFDGQIDEVRILNVARSMNIS